MYFCIQDRDGRFKTAQTEEYARELNEQGFGVFWTPNVFRGKRRKANLERIRFWFCELDEGSKEEQVRRIRYDSPILPSAVIESRRGFHVYWRVNGEASLENFRLIQRWGIVPTLGADPKATDVTRLLRRPGFYHQKQEPFMVRVVHTSDHAYTEEQMLRAFNPQPPQSKRERTGQEPEGQSFWERVASLDGREALERLSGHWLVNHERFRLEEQPNGHANIVREEDDYSTGSFVDADGRLGNVDGGSSIAAWCRWYGHEWREIADGLREVFPELCDLDDGR